MTSRLQDFDTGQDLLSMVLVTPEKDLAVLGGGDSIENSAPSIMAKYRSLPRPAQLPGLKKSIENDFSSDALKELFMKYFDGKIHATLSHHCETETEVKFYDDDYGDDDIENTAITCTFTHFSSWAMDFDDVAKHLSMEFRLGTAQFDDSSVKWEYPKNNSLFDFLTADHKDLLEDRLLHRFFRTGAAFMSPSFSEHLYRHLRRGYMNNKNWKELVDLELGNADSCFTTMSHNILHYTVKLGEALEGAGRFREAAYVYEDVTELIDDDKFDFITNNQITNIHSTMTRNFAGVAYRRAGEHDLSEKAYVEALWHDRNVRCSSLSSWDLSDQCTHNIFVNMLTLLECDAESDRRRYSPLLRGLLLNAGYEPDDHEDPRPFDRIKGSIHLIIKSKFKNAKQAKRLLGQALASPNVSTWREKIWSCHNPSSNVSLEVFNDRMSYGKKEINREAKDQARGLMTREVEENSHRSKESFLCKYPACSKEIPKNSKGCPCQIVHYCGRECQVAHWPDHKKVCPARSKNRTGK